MSFFRLISLIIIAKCGTVAEVMPCPRANICDSSKHTSSILIAGCRPVVEITLSRNRCFMRARPCNDDA